MKIDDWSPLRGPQFPKFNLKIARFRFVIIL